MQHINNIYPNTSRTKIPHRQAFWMLNRKTKQDLYFKNLNRCRSVVPPVRDAYSHSKSVRIPQTGTEGACCIRSSSLPPQDQCRLTDRVTTVPTNQGDAAILHLAVYSVFPADLACAPVCGWLFWVAAVVAVQRPVASVPAR